MEEVESKIKNKDEIESIFCFAAFERTHFSHPMVTLMDYTTEDNRGNIQLIHSHFIFIYCHLLFAPATGDAINECETKCEKRTAASACLSIGTKSPVVKCVNYKIILRSLHSSAISMYR